jgi:phosphatidylglycerophosphatase C
MKNKVIAIFDFDGTITKGDTFLPFLFHSFGIWRTLWCLTYCSPFLFAYMINLVTNHHAKEKMIYFLFNKLDIKKLKLISQKFVEHKLEKHLRNNVLDRLKWHQKHNHITVLISASLDIYINPWAKKFNFSFVESTKLEKHKNIYTGKINGNNCYGIEKVNRLENIFQKTFSNYHTYGYGDSVGDKFFIDLCDFKYYKDDLLKL